MDNFGGAAAWDRYCDRQEELLRYDMMNTQCKKCRRFSDDDGFICTLTGEAVDPDDYAIDIDCEDVMPQ